MKLKFELWKASDGWRWHAKRAGRIVAESGEAYVRRSGALKALKAIISAVRASKYTITVISIALLVCVCGCAHMHSVTYRAFPILLANGVLTNGVEKTECSAYTLWDSSSTLAKFRNQSSPSSYGNNTFAPGTYAAGLNESSTSTNINQLAADITAAAVSAAIKSK